MQSDLLFIKENYLKRILDLSDTSSLEYTFKSIDTNMQEIQKISQSTSANTRIGEIINEPEKDLALAIEELKSKSMAANTTDEYLVCEGIVSRAIKDLNNIKLQVQESSYNISTESKNISESRRNTLAYILFIGFVFAIAVSIIIHLSISWPLREIITSVRQIAVGNFTQEIIPFGCREANDVVKELNISITSLRSLIGKINTASENIMVASETLKIAANDSGRSADEVAHAMRELSEASLNQTGCANQTVLKTKSLGNMVKTISSETKNISMMSEDISSSAQNGQSITNKVSDEINQLYHSTNEINNIIKDFQTSTKEIGNISDEIQEITDEITLLSLNAAIESARAGIHGKGFSIVANATGKLAERCRTAAQIINDRVTQMGERTFNTAKFMEQEIRKINDGRILADQAATTFDGIFNELKTVLSSISDIANSIQEMNLKNDEMFNEVMNIASISENNMIQTKDVSAITDKQSATAQMLTLHAENLMIISDEMKQTTKIFKI
jgi:methyl-accepting chemotaxis protein